MNDPVKILCVDDEPNVLRALDRIFMDDDFEIITAGSGAEGLQALARNPDISVVISDYRMPGMNGVEFLREVYACFPDTIRIVLSGYADTASVVAAINEGKIYKFVPKPWNDDDLRQTVIKAFEAYQLKRKNDELADELREKNEELTMINEKLESLVSSRIADILIPSDAQVLARAALKQLPVGVVEIMSEGLISQVNDEAARLLNCTAVHSIGLRMLDLLPKEICATYDQVMAQGEADGGIKLQGSDYIILGRKLKDGEGNYAVLVLYPGGLR